MEILEKCPLCNNPLFDTFLTCEDWLSSHEQFELKKCKSCGFVFTSPRPDAEALPRYYQSKQYISHTGKPTGLIDWIYLCARKFTLRRKIRLIKKYKQKISILDFGCGTGEFLRLCKEQGWPIAGLEPSADARAKATEITGINIASDLAQFNNQKFDVITMWHVLEHVGDPKQTVSRLRSLLSEDGLLLIAVPNLQSYDASYYKQFWAGYDVPRHFWHFTKVTMTSLVQSLGLKIKAIEPMRLDAFYVSLLSEKYISKNRHSYLTMLKGLTLGLISNRKAQSALNYSSLIYVVTP